MTTKNEDTPKLARLELPELLIEVKKTGIKAVPLPNGHTKFIMEVKPLKTP